jgi:membrane protease YdiL (CAAX protease family)
MTAFDPPPTRGTPVLSAALRTTVQRATRLGKRALDRCREVLGAPRSRTPARVATGPTLTAPEVAAARHDPVVPVPTWALLALGAAITAWSLVANWLLGDMGYTTRNLVLTAAVLVGARSAGLSQAELGLERVRLRAGLRWGGGAAAVVAAGLLAVVAFADVLPGAAALLGDERADLQGAALAHASLVRIPIGTALFEEVLFRGVLLAVLLRRTTPSRAAFVSSAVFGLWHVAPTAVSLELNGVVASSPEGIAAIAATVAVTTVAGLVFTWLRQRSGSLVAPVLAHWATNALGLLAAAASRTLA